MKECTCGNDNGRNIRCEYLSYEYVQESCIARSHLNNQSAELFRQIAVYIKNSL